MQTSLKYLEASFISFLIHAAFILYLLGFFYFENSKRSVISKPINVNLIFESPNIESNIEKSNVNKIVRSPVESLNDDLEIKKNTISFDELVVSSDIQNLINEDNTILEQSDQNKIDLFSSMIISNIQSAWRKPINIQDNLVCEMLLTVNKNGRIIKTNLIKSSGNIRFDNSALKAVERVETFIFFDDIPQSLYQTNFRTIQIRFNPA